MPAVTCQCGALTNSAISEYWLRVDQEHEIAEGCYAKWVEDHWEPGCLYGTDRGSAIMQVMAREMIARTIVAQQTGTTYTFQYSDGDDSKTSVQEKGETT